MKPSRPNWPAPLPKDIEIRTYQPEHRLNLSRLEPEQKRAKWAEIQRQQPALAQLLGDPNLQALRQAFGADIYIEEESNDNE